MEKESDNQEDGRRIHYFRTLRKISTKQFCKYSDGYVWICEIPDLLSEKATLNDLINYAINYDNAVGIKWELYEMVDIEVKLKPKIIPAKRLWKSNERL